MKKFKISKIFLFMSFILLITFIFPDRSFSEETNLYDLTKLDSLSVIKKDNFKSQEVDDTSTATLLAKSNMSSMSYSVANQRPLVTDEWQFFIAPYLWFVGLNGDVAINGNQSEVDASFGDIWDQLDFAFQIRGEAMKKRYFFFVDWTYMKLSIDQDIQPQLPLPIGASIEIDVKMNTLEFAGGYRLTPEKPEVPVYFDLYAGGRWWILDLDQEIRFNNLPNQSTDQNEQWFDFFVGARLLAMANNFVGTVRTDIGGFDFGFSSKITWNILANVGYETGWHGFTPYIGWRTLYVDYDDGSGSDFFQYKVWMNGIQAGLGFRF